MSLAAEASIHSILSESVRLRKANDEAKVDAEEGDEKAVPLPLTKRDKILRIASMALMSLVLIGYGMCVSLFAPFFPTEAARRDVSTTVVGLIFSTYTFMMFIGSLISGTLLTELGLHFMIGSGTLLAGVSTVLFGLLDQSPPGSAYIAACFIVRFVEGIGASLYSIAAFSCGTALFPGSIGTTYAILRTCKGAGLIVGPTLGGALYNAGGFSLPFYVLGAVLLVFGFASNILLRVTLTDSLLQEITKKKKETTTAKGNNFLTKMRSLPLVQFLRKSKEAWFFSITNAALSVVLVYCQPTLALYVEGLGLTDAFTVGLVFLSGSLAFTVFSVVFGRLSDKFPKHIYIFMTIGGIVLIIGGLFLGPIPPLQSFLKPSVGLTTGGYLFSAVGVSMISNAMPVGFFAAARRARLPDNLDTTSMIAGLYNSMFYLGSVIGTPLAGLLMDTIGFAWGAVVIGAIGLIIVLSFMTRACLACFSSRNNKASATETPAISKEDTKPVKEHPEDDESGPLLDSLPRNNNDPHQSNEVRYSSLLTNSK